MKPILILLALAVTACGKTMPTGPVASDRQIIGPCYVSKIIMKNGDRYTFSVHYDMCPPIAAADSLGEIETVTRP